LSELTRKGFAGVLSLVARGRLGQRTARDCYR
jgi:hypothetical protein